MKNKEKNKTQGRKISRKIDSYLLLFLAKKERYGGELVTMCEELIPFNQFDSAMVYRTLKRLEKEGAIESNFKKVDSKMLNFYSMTELGYEILKECHTKVMLNMENLTFFIQEYSKLEVSYD